MDYYFKDLVKAERRFALKAPVLEAEYILSEEKIPLLLYDCLVPRIKEYLVSKP